jgi:acetyl-CoA synthetase
LAAAGQLVTEQKAKRLIADYGLPVVDEELVHDAAGAQRAAARLGYPVVAKIASPDIAHKARVGGVRLGLRTAAEVEGAFTSILASISALRPAVRVDGVLVQPLVTGLEVIIGLKRDPQFGMTILFGLGGVLVETLRQVAVRLAPIGEADARDMIEGIPALKAILGQRSGDGKAVATLVRLLLRLSELAMELRDDIEVLDLNPVILEPATERATVVDALIVRRNQSD